MNRALLATMAVLAMVSFTIPALTQSDENRTTARAAAQAAHQAFINEDYARAATLFREAEALVHAPVHLLYIARAEAKLGDLVAAQEAYLKVAYEKYPASAPQVWLDAQKQANEELAELKSRVPRLTVMLNVADLTDFTLVLDGEEVPGVAGIPRPVNPGTHQVGAKAPGWASDAVKVELAEGGAETVTLQLYQVAEDEVSESTAAPGAAEETTPDTGSTASGANRIPAVKVAGFAALGVGAVGIGAGIGFTIAAKKNRKDADAFCDGDQCPLSKRGDIEDLDSKAKTKDALSVVSFSLGGVGLATGVTLLVLSRNRSKAATWQWRGVTVEPDVSWSRVGLRGRF